MYCRIKDSRVNAVVVDPAVESEQSNMYARVDVLRLKVCVIRANSDQDFVLANDVLSHPAVQNPSIQLPVLRETREAFVEV